MTARFGMCLDEKLPEISEASGGVLNKTAWPSITHLGIPDMAKQNTALLLLPIILIWLLITACTPPKPIVRSPAALESLIASGITIALPEQVGSPVSAVIIMHGGGDPIWRQGYKDWIEWLNRRGYAAVFVDSATPRGLNGQALMSGTFMPRERAADLYVTMQYLRKQPAIDGSRIAVMGFSHGADSALDALVQLPPAGPLEALNSAPSQGLDGLRAIIAFYPGCRQPIMGYRITEVYDRPWKIPLPVLIFQGEKDTLVDIELCQKVVERQKALGTPVEYIFYPDTPHCFDAVYSDDDPNCRMAPEPAADAKAKVDVFLKAHLNHPTSNCLDEC
jgi:dienelactone hydrolase